MLQSGHLTGWARVKYQTHRSNGIQYGGRREPKHLQQRSQTSHNIISIMARQQGTTTSTHKETTKETQQKSRDITHTWKGVLFLNRQEKHGNKNEPKPKPRSNQPTNKHDEYNSKMCSTKDNDQLPTSKLP